MELLKDVGAIAGLAAFIGLAVLALLYFAQARDVRRLRESASFLIEGEEDGSQVAPAVRPADRAAAAAAVAAEEPEQAAAAAAATAPDDREAFRRAELARQAAERRQRFERRRGAPRGRLGAGGGSGSGGGKGRPAWLSETPSTAVIAVGALLLVAGLAFGATRLVGGDDGNAPGGQAEKGAKPSPTKVAVLNGTAEGGLAAQFAQVLKPQGFDVGPVSNTAEPFDTSLVMFDTGAQATAQQVAGVVGIQDVQPISPEIRQISEGATVVLVLGEDQATGSTGTEGTDTTSGVSGI